MAATYGELLKKGAEMLRQAGTADARYDAEWLLLAVTEKTRSFLFLHGEEECGNEAAEQYFQLIARRSDGEPVQYITGSQEFMGLSFEVNPSVLIPRQDTETLAEQALAEAAEMPRPLRVLDLCCGSGAIAVSVAHALPEAEVTAADVSEASLDTARRNAENNHVADRISFLRTDMFSAFREKAERGERAAFDLILCNPPYIPTEVIPTLQKEITEHEPVGALDGGADGLDFYRILAEDAWHFLEPDGKLIVEIGSDQAESVSALFRAEGHYMEPAVVRDLAGKDRVIRCRKR